MPQREQTALEALSGGSKMGYLQTMLDFRVQILALHSQRLPSIHYMRNTTST